MITYKVTTELKTTLWLKILRFFRLKRKRDEFEIQLAIKNLEKNEILNNGYCDIKILDYGNMDMD